MLAVGDWGGNGTDYPTTPSQIATAAGMAAAVQVLGVDSVLLLGDNFYDSGVANVTSWRFQDTFENVYSRDGLKDLPFYVIAGNHDYYTWGCGNLTCGNVSAQIDYSNHSPRWRFPSPYYNVTRVWAADSGERRAAELLLIDTVELAGVSDDACLGCRLPGPADGLHAEDQWAWIERRLSASTADFLLVAGHYPVYSAGDDGTTAALVSRLLPLLAAHGAHYISGHDHMFEHIVHGGVHMFVSGMGNSCCYGDGHLATVPAGALRYMLSGANGTGAGVGPAPPAPVQGGFASLAFGDEYLRTVFHAQDGTQLYAAPPIHRRTEPADIA